MRKWLYGAVGTVVVAALLPALGAFSVEVAKAAGWVTVASGAMSEFADWLVQFASSQSYGTFLVPVLAFAVGVGLDWATRRAEASRSEFYADLAARLETERERLVNIHRLDDGPDLENEVTREMTLAYLDQMALQKTLQSLGFKVPWLTWEVGTGMGEYLTLYIGYFAILSAHLKVGHIREAKIASKRAVDWGSGKGPYLKYGGALQRLY